MKDDFFATFISMIYVSAIALCGILVRIGQAAAMEEFKWRQAGIALLSAPGLGIIANGFALWLYPQLPTQALAAIIALVGFLGPAFILALTEKIQGAWLNKWSQKP